MLARRCGGALAVAADRSWAATDCMVLALSFEHGAIRKPVASFPDHAQFSLFL
jgi:hypothetical protein